MKKRYLVAFVFVILALSACRIESNILLDINEDGSARIGAEIGFDDEMMALVGQGGGNLDDIIGELSNIAGTSVETINRTEGDMTYFGATSSVEDLSTHTFDGIQANTFSSFSYIFDENGATLAARVDATGLGDLADGQLPIDPAQITADVFSGNVVVKMPGTVVEHNADSVRSDGTLVWSLPISGSTDVLAVSTFGSSSSNWIGLVVALVLLLGGGAAVAAVVMSRKKEKETVAQAAAEHDAALEETSAADDDAVDPSDGDSAAVSSDDGESSGNGDDNAQADDEAETVERSTNSEPERQEDQKGPE